MNNDLSIKRSNDLIEARFSLSAKQNDIIDLLLTKIEDDAKLEYEININDYLIFYTKDSSNIYRDFKKAVDEFVTKNSSFKIYNYRKDSNKSVFFWFIEINYLKDISTIRFRLDAEVKKILLQIKNVTYYKIKYTLNFNSIYSKRLYLYLKRFDDTGIRVSKVIDLLNKMNCPKSYYERYNAFKQKVLDIAEREINGHTDITFTYEEIKKGRKVTCLKFHIEKDKDIKEIEVKENKNDALLDLNNKIEKIKIKKDIEKDIDIKEIEKIKKEKDKDIKKTEVKENKNDALLDLNNKNDVQYISIGIDKFIDELRKIIKEPITIKDLKVILAFADYDVSLIEEKYKIAKKQGNIRNLTAWLIDSIRNDYKQPIELQASASNNKYINRFANYDQRNWDFDELKKMDRELLFKETEKSNEAYELAIKGLEKNPQYLELAKIFDNR